MYVCLYRLCIILVRTGGASHLLNGLIFAFYEANPAALIALKQRLSIMPY